MVYIHVNIQMLIYMYMYMYVYMQNYRDWHFSKNYCELWYAKGIQSLEIHCVYNTASFCIIIRAAFKTHTHTRTSYSIIHTHVHNN